MPGKNKPNYKISVVWRHDAHPVSFTFHKKAEWEKKWSEVSADMKIADDRGNHKTPKYAYACSGELEYTTAGVVFHMWGQLTRGFGTYPKYFYPNS